MPGTATTSSPRTTSGQPSRSERGTFASTNTSWIFFRAAGEPVARAPPSYLKPWQLRLDPPFAPLDRAARSWARARARAGRAPGPPAGRRRGRRASSPRASPAAGRARAASSAARRARAGRSRARAGCSCSSSGSISWRISPRSVPGFVESVRHSSPRSRQNASVSSRQTQSSGRTTPSSRRTLIPFVLPARREAVEDRLDLVGERVPGRPQLARRGTSSARRATRPRSSSARRPGRPPRRSARAHQRASASDSAPRRPWSTCSADTS